MPPQPRGLYAEKLPGTPSEVEALAGAICELNMTPGTATDRQQARALQAILARRGMRIVSGLDGVIAQVEGAS